MHLIKQCVSKWFVDYTYTNDLKWKLRPASELQITLNFQSEFMVQICEFYSLEKFSKISQHFSHSEQFCGLGFKTSFLKIQHSLSINNLWKVVKKDTMKELQHLSGQSR